MKLNPDPVWLRRGTGQWKKVVLDVKVTSTDKLKEALKEKLRSIVCRPQRNIGKDSGKSGGSVTHHLPMRGLLKEIL